MNKAILYTPLAAVCLALLGMPAATAASFQTTTTTFNVTGTVPTVAGCTVAATAMDFGTLSAFQATAPTGGQSQLTVHCSNGTPYEVGMSYGLHAACGSGRCVQNGPYNFAYSLFTDSAMTSIWGPIGGANATVTGTGNGADQILQVYGMPGAPAPADPPGTYTDTVTVTVQY